MRTFEQRLKFDHGLPVGRSLVVLVLANPPAGREASPLRALVEVTARGRVYILPKPDDCDMYTSWRRITGDTMKPGGAIIVWGARDPDLMRQFEGEPAATVSVWRQETPHHEKPCAAAPWHSYRYRGRYGWVMIGAMDHAEALREAARSISYHEPTIDRLQVWNGWAYESATAENQPNG